MARAAVLNGGAADRLERLPAHHADFFNVAVLFSQGLFHQIHSQKPIPWGRLPVNAMQMRGEPETDCYRSQCRPLPF
jgi:hypothetical protein